MCYSVLFLFFHPKSTSVTVLNPHSGIRASFCDLSDSVFFGFGRIGFLFFVVLFEQSRIGLSFWSVIRFEVEETLDWEFFCLFRDTSRFSGCLISTAQDFFLFRNISVVFCSVFFLRTCVKIESIFKSFGSGLRRTAFRVYCGPSVNWNSSCRISGCISFNLCFSFVLYRSDIFLCLFAWYHKILYPVI